ncbi:MAG: hypothetical protein KGJ68_14685, partial [Gammaproteobacteria bacterium]|nr:hypothetical protein [Gammaproteobacteria bacterium]
MSTLERRFRPFPSWIPQAIALLAVPTAGLAAEKYFGYAEGHIEVTAAGTDAYAVNLAHSCLRLDAMLRQILGITTSHRVPTY